ncbi:phosphotransferase family protein [Natronosalvus rutilus]|uniref:Phosphotransferase n=1 Tax=Natronosalvus rutilus TaxID=2953753 RepID=A0A9E7N8A7_9EURY|nr:phosphotransferase [Natronosalvus rutilus]UTF52085.1 phosphotransferase [Natronosalvus rutilus]
MDDVPEARALSASAVDTIVRTIDPALEVRDTTAVERGFCSVYRLEVADDDGSRSLFLKCSPDGQPWGISDEARVQAVLDAHTSIPVPEVLGVVDDHETLPAPCYLMEALPGEALPYEDVCYLEDDPLSRLARETGEYLAELHAVPAVERFGHVRRDGPDLVGGRPECELSTLTVGNPRTTWSEFLRAYVDRELERHADSRFSTLTSDLTRWLEARIDALAVEGPFDPVLGRNDHGLHNLLVDSETGEITAMLDWGYTLAVPAAFDFEFAAYLYSGAFLAGLPDVSDRRPLVREAMLSGYRTARTNRAEAVSTPEPLYELVAMVRIMNDFEHLEVPDGSERAVMDRIEADARAILESQNRGSSRAE